MLSLYAGVSRRFGRGTSARFCELYDPEVVFLPMTLEPFGQRYEEVGDHVLVAGTCRVRGRSSGVETVPTCAWLMTVRDGRIVSHRAFPSYDEAAAAAGPEPPRSHPL